MRNIKNLNYFALSFNTFILYVRVYTSPTIILILFIVIYLNKICEQIELGI